MSLTISLIKVIKKENIIIGIINAGMNPLIDTLKIIKVIEIKNDTTILPTKGIFLKIGVYIIISGKQIEKIKKFVKLLNELKYVIIKHNKNNRIANILADLMLILFCVIGLFILLAKSIL
tara:strand:+ start:13782 stop:14141 length:360 start_codon:yes stop_codon:yes gene_type:complete